MQNKKSLISFALVTLFFLGCTRALQPTVTTELSTGIINGTPVEKNEMAYKTTARILVVSGEGFWLPGCTASILTDELILTAAHCVYGNSFDTVRIGFGIEGLTVDGQLEPQTRIDVLEKFETFAVTGIQIHPGYSDFSGNYDHDMALIRISGKIPGGFHSIPLMPEDKISGIKETETYQVLLAGFGLISEDPMTESEILRKTVVSARFEGLHLITDQTQGSGGCHGDSGGPAYLQVDGTYYLVGVTHGPTLSSVDCHHEGVWGNPSREKEFLNKAAEALQSSQRFH